ncbi:hypothetical protein HanPSC8_Chr05g0203571 [Helianthus annuus]|nr:hypothetical protein HanPSC8_Chr05g0203571 [Helianthus annuus]
MAVGIMVGWQWGGGGKDRLEVKDLGFNFFFQQIHVLAAHQKLRRWVAAATTL